MTAVLERLAAETELVTCLAGVDAPLASNQIDSLAPTHVEIEHGHGGQPNYWYLLVAE